MASRILLADDSITIQKVVNLTFADEGIEVVAVSSGDIAERRLPEVSPDLVLADIFMPGKNGYELCEAIKENSQFQHVPVVLLVGAFEPFDQAEANRVKADAHLTKPFESRTLVETVRRLISTSGEGNASSGAATPSVHDEAEEAIDALAPAETSTPHVAPVARIDFSAMMPENNYDSTPPVRTTGELGSPTPHLSHSDFDMAADTREPSLMSPDVNEPIEVFEFSGNGNFAVSDSSNSLSMDHQEMVEDFDRNDVLEPIAETHHSPSFQSESNSLLDVDISGAGEGESWYSPAVFESTQANQQPVAGEWQSSADNSPVLHSPADLSIHTEGTLDAVHEPTDTACATLLAVDEPLGDVFFEETATVDPLVLSQPSSGDALGFEFAESEIAGTAGSEATQFNVVESFEQPPQETSFDFVESPAAEIPVSVETAVQEFAPEVHKSTAEGADVQETVVEMHEPAAKVHETVAPTFESAAQMPEPSAQMPEPAPQIPEPAYQTAEPVTQFADVAASDVEAHMPEATVHMPDANAQMPEAVVERHAALEATDTPSEAGQQVWTTPQATIQSTADLDSMVMPVQPDVPQDSAPFEPEPVMTESSNESTSGHMWTEEETRFTPIDIEAVALEDAPVGSTTQSDPQSETGFVVSSVLAEEPPAKVEASVDDELEESKSAGVASDLSAAAIDQIVRRVLSQMSESVVREVAWEVVPDCVERVIEQLTRESLSKRA